MIKIQYAGDVGFVIARSENKRRCEFTRIFVQGVSIGGEKFRAAIISPELNVHDAGDSVRSINTRSAVLKDLDAFQCGLGDRVEIDEGYCSVIGA